MSREHSIPPGPWTTIYAGFVICSLLLISLAALAGTGTDGVQMTLKADDPRVVQAGEQIYQQHCSACHGSQLEGQADWRTRTAEGLLPAPPHDASGHTWHHADDLLFEITKYGASVVIDDPEYRSAMPVYQNILTDEEIVAVLSFIKSTWPEEQRQWQEEVNGPKTGSLLPRRKSSSFLDQFNQ